MEKGTTNGTQTDFDGNFTLTVSDNATLVISYIGYSTTEVAVDGQSTINVTRPKITNFPYIEDFNADDGYWLDTMETATSQFIHGPVPYLAGPQSNGNSWYADVSSTNCQIWLV